MRKQGLKSMDGLFKQGIIKERNTGPTLLADAATLVKDKKQASSLAEEAAKSGFIRPESGKKKTLDRLTK